MVNDSGWVVTLSAFILISFMLLIAFFWWAWRMTQREHSLSPYTGVPLRHAREIPYYGEERILRFLYDMRQYDNRIFKFGKAAFCRETGRVFQDCVNLFDTIVVDWTFVQKRYPGQYVSWGSLSNEQQDYIRKMHTSLEGFQTKNSSPLLLPRAIDQEHIYTKPGPLYVDMNTKVLLGWKQVPGTDFEVLIVQKPTQHFGSP